MPFTKTIPISVPNGANDFEETGTVRRSGADIEIAVHGGGLSETRAIMLASLSSVTTAAERSGFRAVLREARRAAYLADGCSES